MAKGRVTTEKEEAVATGRVRTERGAAARVVAVMEAERAGRLR